MSEAQLPDGNAITYDYDAAGNLDTVTYPIDGAPAVRRYNYENSLIPHALTGITDENGHRAITNKAYGYDADGFRTSKTDWNGNTTTYTRNAQSQELSRTEAADTPVARTITTDWHPDFTLPIHITEPDPVTEFTNDTEGRQLSKQVRAVQ